MKRIVFDKSCVDAFKNDALFTQRNNAVNFAVAAREYPESADDWFDAFGGSDDSDDDFDVAEFRKVKRATGKGEEIREFLGNTDNAPFLKAIGFQMPKACVIEGVKRRLGIRY